MCTQLSYYVPYRTKTLRERHKPRYSPSYRLIVSLFFFYKGGFSLKLPTKVDMPLNSETKLTYSSTTDCRNSTYSIFMQKQTYHNPK